MAAEALRKEYSSAEIRQRLDKLPRAPLANLPTRLEECKRLTQFLGGPQIWMKRDDQTGLAFGGNKTRQIEFLLGEAMAQGADAIVSGAGSQSNFCRQLTAAAAKFGLKAHLILMGGIKGPELQGNLLLDHLMGAEIEIVDETDSLKLVSHFERKAESLTRLGHSPYVVDSRTKSAPLLSLGYVDAMLELAQQCEERRILFDSLYVSAANMTQAGLALAAKALGLKLRIVGITPILWAEPRAVDIAKIANQAARILGLDVELSPSEILNADRYIGQGYGIPTPEGNAALRLLAETEGIFLDPVYTAKAMAALIDDIRSAQFKKQDKVLFLHTGGTPALFSYARDMTQTG
jgi:D-cysteine desulfhydrase family pyridoxal phosphate-dependent enzyme